MPNNWNESAPSAADLAFAQAGRGPDVILIHGAMTSLDDMAMALFPALRSEFNVVAFDRPGHGRNETPRGGSAAWQAEQIRTSAHALGLTGPVIVGHSFGAAVALAYALRYPDEIAGAVVLSPIAFPEPRLEQVLFAPRAFPGPVGFWSHSMGRLTDPILLPVLWRAMFLPQIMPARFAQLFPFAVVGRPGQLYSEAEDAAAMAPSVAMNAWRYPQCQVPIRIFSGDRDIVVNPRVHAAGLAHCVPASRLTMLPGLGHMIHHFAQPPIVQAIRDLHAGVA